MTVWHDKISRGSRRGHSLANKQLDLDKAERVKLPQRNQRLVHFQILSTISRITKPICNSDLIAALDIEVYAVSLNQDKYVQSDAAASGPPTEAEQPRRQPPRNASRLQLSSTGAGRFVSEIHRRDGQDPGFRYAYPQHGCVGPDPSSHGARRRAGPAYTRGSRRPVAAGDTRG